MKQCAGYMHGGVQNVLNRQGAKMTSHDKFEANMDRFMRRNKAHDDGQTLNLGGQYDELLKQAVLDALDDLDNFDENTLSRFSRHAFTEEELEPERSKRTMTIKKQPLQYRPASGATQK